VINKYGAQRVTHEGRSFASKGERDCYNYLKLLEQKGEIDTIECQVSVMLTKANVKMIPDFRFWDHALSEQVYGEYKGFETPEWNIKKRLWRIYGPGRLRIYKGYGLRIELVEEIIPKGEK
jgi:hypothetical protein